MTFEIYEQDGTNNVWRWHLRARNGKIVASDCNDYTSQRSVLRIVKRLRGRNTSWNIVKLGPFSWQRTVLA